MLQGANFTLDFYYIVEGAYLHINILLLEVYEDLVVGTESKYCFKKSVHSIETIFMTLTYIDTWSWV